MLLSEKCGKFAQNNHFRIPMHTSATEKTTDTIVYNLMREAQLNPQPEKSSIIEVEEALRTASNDLRVELATLNGYVNQVIFS